jgi:hypothetical protein
MNRRQFTFWIGFGLFSISEKFHLAGLDCLAAAAMRRTESKKKKVKAVETVVGKNYVGAEHWTVAGDETWRWFERENHINGTWRNTGTTTPINKTTGQPKAENIGYIDDSLVPAEMRLGEPADLVTHTSTDLDPQLPTTEYRNRHGRPPSKWLRSLNADEITIWLKTIDVPAAGVSGMTFWNHLTRDHSFDPEKIKGLVEKDQEKLHAAAHYGY